MATQLFVNLPVKDLEKTKAFFTTLGFTYNPMFTDEKAACLIISDTINAMLLTESFFQTFTKKEIANAHNTAQVILALSTDSRELVDEMIQKVIAAGGEPLEAIDHGFMYQHAFHDLDGHIWEIFWMDPAGIPQQ